MKKTIIALVVVIIVGVGLYFWFKSPSTEITVNPNNDQSTGTSLQSSESTSTQSFLPTEVIGKSIEGRDITVYHFGTGPKEILFVGGLHGGYEWNTALVAYQLVDYLTANPTAVPSGEVVTVIPVTNPDGLYKVTKKDGRFTAADVSSSQLMQISGRYNANTVDLNRNFDCDWQTQGKWQTKTVSGGSAAFSEPESKAIRDYVLAHTPAAVVVYYSAVGGVFSSNCHDGVLPETATLTSLYARASGYPAYQEFNYYEITGDMVNWLAKEKIPAISVLLTNHTDTEWTKNLAGIKAILQSK